MMKKEDSVRKALVQPCLRVIHSVRTIVPVITMVAATIVPVRDKVVTSSVRVAISLARVRKAVISPVKVDTSSVREAISPVRDRAVDTSSARVVIRNLMASRVIPIKKVRASIRLTTIRMLSIA